MKIKSAGYTLRECVRNIARNGLMSVASMTSVAATLLILGIIFILIVNINALAQGAKEQFDTIQVYLNDELTLDQVEDLQTSINKLQGVREIRFETKEEALEKFKREWGDNAYLLEGLESNPLPNAFVVRLSDMGYTNYVVSEIKDLSGVEEVKYYQEIVTKMLNVTTFIKNIGMGIIFILIAISTFIINNTIKLALNARRREITIMKYVGATSWFVRWPFVLEGMVLGMFGALIATGVLYGIYSYTYELFTSQFYVLIAAYIVNVKTIVRDLLVLFMVIGMGIGALGSLLSIRRYLEA